MTFSFRCLLVGQSQLLWSPHAYIHIVQGARDAESWVSKRMCRDSTSRRRPGCALSFACFSVSPTPAYVVPVHLCPVFFCASNAHCIRPSVYAPDMKSPPTLTSLRVDIALDFSAFKSTTFTQGTITPKRSPFNEIDV